MYEIFVALIVLTHFVFIGYVVVGGFLALRRRRTIWLHVAAVGWAVTSAAGNIGCPLTGFERWARNRAGMAPLTSEGFVAHYITGVLYPVGWVTAVQVLVFAIVAASWAGYAWRGRRVADPQDPAHDATKAHPNRSISPNGGGL